MRRRETPNTEFGPLIWVATIALLFWSLRAVPWREVWGEHLLLLQALLQGGVFLGFGGILAGAAESALLLLAVWLPGDRIVKAWLVEERRAGWAIGYGAGLVLHSLLLTVFSAAGLLSERAVIALVSGCAAIALFHRWARPDQAPKTGGAAYVPELVERLAQATVAVLLAGPGLLAVIMPTFFYDSLVYHFGVPAQYLKAGGFIPLRYNVFSSFPMGWDMLNVFGPAFGCPDLSKALSWGALAALAQLLSLSSRRKSYLAAALFCSMPAVLYNVYSGGVELGIGLFLVLAWHCFLRAEAETTGSEGRWIILGAAFAGMTLAVKYLSALPWAIGAAVLAWRTRRLKPVLIYLAAGVFMTAPWLIKNTVYHGNPIYPFAAGSITESLSRAAQPISLRGLAPWINFLSPWKAFVASIADMEYVGPASLWLLPFLWLGRYSVGVPALAVLFLMSWAGWAFSTGIVRYLIPVLSLGAAAFARAFDGGALQESTRRQAGAAALVVCWTLAAVSSYSIIKMRGWSVAFGQESAQTYFSRERLTWFNPYTPIIPAVSKLPPDARILLIGEARSYYLPRRVEMSSALEPQIVALWSEKARSGDELRQRFKEEGVTHILLNLPEALRFQSMGGLFPWSEKGRGVFSQFWRSYVEEEASSVYFKPETQYAVFLYRLRNSPRPLNEKASDNPVLGALYP